MSRYTALFSALALTFGFVLTACGGGGGGGTTFVPPSGTGPLIYTTDSGNAIQEFAATANGNVSPLASISGVNTQLNGATGIARDSSGRIYTANQSGNQIVAFSSTVTGVRVTVLVTPRVAVHVERPTRTPTMAPGALT